MGSRHRYITYGVKRNKRILGLRLQVLESGFYRETIVLWSEVVVREFGDTVIIN